MIIASMQPFRTVCRVAHQKIWRWNSARRWEPLASLPRDVRPKGEGELFAFILNFLFELQGAKWLRTREFEGEDCLPSSPFKVAGNSCSSGWFKLSIAPDVSIFQTEIPQKGELTVDTSSLETTVSFIRSPIFHPQDYWLHWCLPRLGAFSHSADRKNHKASQAATSATCPAANPLRNSINHVKERVEEEEGPYVRIQVIVLTVTCKCNYLQSWEKVLVRGLVKFVCAVP